MFDDPRQLKVPITVEELKNGELYGIYLQAKGESAPLSDEYLLQQLFVAEDAIGRYLALAWEPTRVFSDPIGRQSTLFPMGVAVLPPDYDADQDWGEPAYNYDQDFWGEERWGFMMLNYRPVRSITQVFFAFPGTQPVWTVPNHWHRIDQKFGTVQMVPASTNAVYASFNAFVMGVIAGGRGLPQSIFVDYVVGFTKEELLNRHQDLLEAVRLSAMLGMMGVAQTIVAPGGVTGGSLGLDGLSRSNTFGGKWGPFSGKIELARDRLEAILGIWKKRERGVPVVFV